MAVTSAEVNAAIDSVMESGQVVAIDGQSYTQANLSDLIKLRDKIKSQTARENGTRPVFRAFKMSGMGY